MRIYTNRSFSILHVYTARPKIVLGYMFANSLRLKLVYHKLCKTQDGVSENKLCVNNLIHIISSIIIDKY